MGPQNSGCVVISLDTELGWGFHGTDADNHLSTDGVRERDIIRTLLETFDQFDAPVTWAVVGHLFLEECSGAHPELPEPDYGHVAGSWYDHDPGGTIYEEPLRFGSDIVDEIIDAEQDHEIASHTFSHLLCRTNGCSADILRAELEATRDLGEEKGVEISSLVFPKNQVNYLETVADTGIEVYRGISPEMRIMQEGVFGGVRRHFRHYLRRTPPIATPQKVSDSLWELPASQLLHFDPERYPSERNWIPSMRVQRAKKAMRTVEKQGGVYHLWTHPHEFDASMTDDLTAIFKFANQRELPIRTMREAVLRIESG